VIDASRQRRQHVVVTRRRRRKSNPGDGECSIRVATVAAEDALVGHGGSALRKYSGGAPISTAVAPSAISSRFMVLASACVYGTITVSPGLSTRFCSVFFPFITSL
jgi:hypothetical protein